jgi:hypothetical protein
MISYEAEEFGGIFGIIDLGQPLLVSLKYVGKFNGK